MPAQVQRSAFLAKLGDSLHRAHAQHAATPVEYSQFGELPEIPNGIARLVEMKFKQIEAGKQNAGQYVFYAAGVVVSPREVKDAEGQPMRVEGLRTSIIESLYETPGKSRQSVEDHLGWVYNELKKFGVDTASIAPDQLEQVAEALKASQPYFRFSTRAGKVQTEGPYAGKPPMIFHEWKGQCEYHEADDGGGVTDNTPAEPPRHQQAAARPSANGAGKATASPAAQSAPAQPAKAAASKKPAASPPPPPPPPAVEYSDAEDLDSLVERANAPDSDDSQAARDRLIDLARARGGEALAKKAEDAPSWAAVANMLRGPAAQQAEPGDDGAAEDGAPAVGDIYLFAPPPSKPGGKRGKAVEVEVKAVVPALRTCTVERLDDKVSHNNVPWTDLIAQ